MQDDDDVSSDDWSGSGIWEKTENRRWIVVDDHIIPRIDRSVPDSSLVPGLGIGQYIENFEIETEMVLNSSKLVTRGSMVVRISVELEPEEPNLPSTSIDEEPVPGPSGCSHRGEQTTDASRLD